MSSFNALFESNKIIKEVLEKVITGKTEEKNIIFEKYLNSVSNDDFSDLLLYYIKNEYKLNEDD